MSTPLLDEVIMALVDDELEAHQAMCVRDAIDNDAHLRAKFEVFLMTRALLSRAFDPILNEPVPERLARAVLGGEPRRGRRPS